MGKMGVRSHLGEDGSAIAFWEKMEVRSHFGGREKCDTRYRNRLQFIQI
ncbi:hypothetical protein [Argonema antarcticum]|nr:hypothetical protein [Argonema antarcticum]MCL1474979.1 hypothetical protein [Argonema antarcticum A004/B2]